MNSSEKRRIVWAEREANGLCVYCGKFLAQEGKKGCQNCLQKKVNATVKFCQSNKETTAQYRLLLKHEVIKKYGGKCACCNETEILFLTIDHINNDGYQDRMEIYGIKNPATTSWYLKLRRDPIRNDLQVLCFNCNLGKSLNNGVCPHKIINRILLSIYDKRHDPQFDTRLKIVWPTDDELINMCNETTVAQVARKLGVDFTAVSGRLQRRGKYNLVNKKSGGIKRGEDNSASKLTKIMVNEIREKYSTGLSSRKELGIEYGVSKSLIDKIVTFKIWS